ncbi:microprocessor complex subunit DGCR8 isoform X2 [Maniola hyperantus]|uniref:microprocessor complex subunit DGCR8 isoform X2 n=1 Tax=Aphantopus hyperantus TaxID=2795564 RepID=UPI00212CC8A7
MNEMNEEIEAVPPPTKKQKFDDENSHSETDFTDDVGDSTEVSKNRNDTDYNNVSSEDMQKLREFKVLDEVKSNEEDSNVEDSDSSDDKSEGLPDEEIEKMLEEDLPEDFKVEPKPKEKPYITRSKIVLEEKGVNQFEVLPLDWMMVRHHSGMPIYLHKGSRVVTLSKPYFLGKGNIRRHDIPISAIPCLAYRRALEEEEKQKEIDRKVEQQIKNLSKKAANQNLENNLKNNQHKKLFSFIDQQATLNVSSSTSNNIRGKCPFKSDTENGEITKKIHEENVSVEVNDNEMKKLAEDNDSIIDSEIANENAENNLADPVEPIDDSMLKTVESGDVGATGTIEDVTIGGTIKENNDADQEEVCDDSSDIDIPLNRQPVILPSGEIMAAPRVESVNKSWKTQNLSPEQFNNYCKSLFKFKTVNIMQFSRWADRRKYAKAKKTLQYPTLPEGTKLITIPVQNSGQENENASTPYQASVYIGGMQYGVGHGSSKRQAKYAAARASIQVLIPEMRQHIDSAADKKADADFRFFDLIGIEDPRIAEFCAATCEPSPHAILRTCLLRNFGASDRHIHTEMKKMAWQEIELTMKVGKHSATVVCKNKKTAKQRASQVILQALHPHVRSWGSLLRLYGSKSVKSCKEKKQEEQQITLLQDKARHNEPNYAVLEKLRNEMRKLRERDESVVPIGTLLFTEDLPTQSGSNLNNVDL